MPNNSRSSSSTVASGVTSRGLTPGAADRDHQVDSADDGGVERVADLHLVGGDHHDPVHQETALTEQLGDQRSAVILLSP